MQHGDAFYFGPERYSKRYAADPVQEGAVCSRIANDMRAAASAERAVFSKDMAYYGALLILGLQPILGLQQKGNH